jgi:hypothetical protein
MVASLKAGKFEDRVESMVDRNTKVKYIGSSIFL